MTRGLYSTGHVAYVIYLRDKVVQGEYETYQDLTRQIEGLLDQSHRGGRAADNSKRWTEAVLDTPTKEYTIRRVTTIDGREYEFETRQR